MELSDYLKALRKRWRVVAWLTLLCLGAAAVITILSPRVYEARAQVYVSVSGVTSDDPAATAYQRSQFIIQQVKSYTELVDSTAVLQPVIDDLDLDRTVASLRGDVSAASPLDTVLIDVRARDADPADAAELVNEVSSSLSRVITQLETPAEGDPAVTVTMTDPAEPPAAPVSPRPKVNIALGLLAGLGIGVGFAALREQLDTSIKSTDDLQKMTGNSPLGVVRFDSRASRQPLVALTQGEPRAEPYRTIRTNLQFVDVDSPPKRFVVTSAVVGEGKTTTACNLAITFAQAGLRVCLVEGDLRRPMASRYLGIDTAAGLTNVLAGQHDLDEVLVAWNRGMFSLLAAGTLPPDPAVLLGSHNMIRLMDQLSDRFDAVIIDAPPLVPVSDAALISRMTDGAILTARYGRTSRDQFRHAVEALETASARLLGTVVTFVPSKRGDLGYANYDSYSSVHMQPSNGSGSESTLSLFDYDEVEHASRVVAPPERERVPDRDISDAR